ncbi:aminoglycoside phosphotransferase family protein, partial [Streptomyces sp. NPDC004285]
SAMGPHRDDAAARALAAAALAAREELVAAETETVLLHGNFRQGKVLAGDRTPWLAVGPEPLVGERAYDLARLVRDRVEDLVAASSGASAARRRVNKLADSLDLDRERLRGWTLFRAVESATRALTEGRRQDAELLLEFASWL